MNHLAENLSRRSFLTAIAGTAALGLPRFTRASERVPTLSLLPFLARPTRDSMLINVRNGHTDAIVQLEIRPRGEQPWSLSGAESRLRPGEFFNWTVEGLDSGSSTAG